MLDAKFNQQLMDEITFQLQEASQLPLGSEEQNAVYSNVAKLYNLALENEKMEQDLYEKDKEQKYQKKVQKAKFILEAISVGITGVSVTATIVGFFKGFKFEETGSISSQTERNLFNKMFKFLK